MNVERHNAGNLQEMKDFTPNKEVKGSMQNLPSKDYESLDYDVCYNKPFSKMLETDNKMSLSGQNVMRWLVTFIIGVCTGLVAVFIDFFVKLLTKWKFDTLDGTIHQNTQSGQLVLSLLLLMLFNGGFTLVAALITAVEPVAAGSGIPEIKCYLNGVKVPNVVRLKTLICKAVGVLFSVAGGLFVGKEGPMIHSGAVIGAGVPQFQSLAFKRIKFNFPYFRTDRDKRDFVSGGAAAGVAAAFGAPIGGVLFSLEEGSSFWNQALTWRTFFCSMSATFTLNFFLSGIATTSHMQGWGTFYQPGLINFGSFECSPGKVGTCNLWTVQDLLIFIAMGFLGGLMGAWFNSLNKDLTIHRMLHVQRGGKLVKILEGVLIALVTTSVAFFCPIYLGQCKPLSDLQGDSHKNETKQYFCSEGHYNDMASLFFNSQETAIKQLFHNDGAFSLPSLGIFFICFYFLACWTYGAGVPSGLFVPCLLCGAAYGRFIAELLRLAGYEHTYNGTFSLIGAAAFLGGVVRMTISLTVILIESTNEISYGLPIMTTLMVAKWSGDLFNEGLYDIHIKLKSVPLLEWAAPQKFFRLQAKDIMESCLSYIYPHTRVQSIVGILKTTAHNAFPVVTLDSDVSGGVSDLDYEGHPLSSNIQYTLNTMVQGVTSEQRQRSRTTVSDTTEQRASHQGLLSDQGDASHLDPATKKLESGQRKPRSLAEVYSISSPLHSFLKRGRGSEDKVSLLHGEEDGSKEENSYSPEEEKVYKDNPEGFGDEKEILPMALTLHGLVLRSQLVTLLKNRIFYSKQVANQPELQFANMTEDYPRYPDVHSLDLGEQDMQMILDVTPYFNPCPYIVFPWTPVPLVFNLFRTMGLRHIVVVNKKGQLVGMITRYNLTEKYMEHCLEIKEANEIESHNS